MSWTRQVWHVLSRDVRRTRWLLVAFLALIAVRVVELVGANRLASHPSALVLIAMYLTAPVLVVLWLQEDTPTDVQGFWTALPLEASAVV
ncbi:MAG: hypothetical protein MUF00_04270, partial [Gemmatimonadaceae bacterium]|nr:hypothetical protein [Gemmatimonadaceae bacterium]